MPKAVVFFCFHSGTKLHLLYCLASSLQCMYMCSIQCNVFVCTHLCACVCGWVGVCQCWQPPTHTRQMATQLLAAGGGNTQHGTEGAYVNKL